MNKKHALAGTASAFGLLALLVIFLPIIQDLLYSILIATPGFTQWTIIALGIAIIGFKQGDDRILIAAAVVFVVMAVFVGPIAGGVYAHSDMANQLQSDATQLDTLPNTSTDHVRALPRSVADNYAESSMQYPQYKLTQSDIAYNNGTYAWSYGLVPDNFMVALLGHQTGALYVEMSTVEKDVSVDRTTFKNGRGQLVTDGYGYQNILKQPFVNHNWGTTFNAKHDGESYIAHSTTRHIWKFRLTPVPQFYAIPQHHTVNVMNPSGGIDTLSPTAAQEDARLSGQNYYPYHLAMFKVESMQYIHGALNKWFWSEDVLKVAELPEGGNSWPLVIPTDDGELTYFIATEPAGSGNGVYEVWTIDGQTGEAGVESYSESQLGPQKAVDFVERHPQVNRLSSAKAVSPVPVVKGETLYWHVKVVPQSLSGVTYTAFVNADSGEVTLLEGTKPIYAFLNESEVKEVKNEQPKDGMAVRVVVTNEAGEIVGTTNVTVPENGTVSIEASND